ncbi:MAG TPA: amino acid ABC transporter permease [Candidatus Babeliales bacterium]|nr:amino acid ABC transporter permease [Candidatus Babeliales bacterium]
MIDINLIINSLPALARGAWLSLQIGIFAAMIGFVLGTILGVIQSRHILVLNQLVTLYTTFMRGTPMLIQIAFAYFLLPQIGIPISAFWVAVIAIGLNSGAYVSHIVRSGIASIDKGQLEAARVLGLSTMQTIRYVILPQAISVVLPALGNELITMVKDSSLASTIGVMELTKEGSLIRSRTYDALSIYVGVMLFYLAMTMTLTYLLSFIEKRMRRHVSN